MLLFFFVKWSSVHYKLTMLLFFFVKWSSKISKHVTSSYLGLGLWCLISLSTTFQLKRFYMYVWLGIIETNMSNNEEYAFTYAHKISNTNIHNIHKRLCITQAFVFLCQFKFPTTDPTQCQFYLIYWCAHFTLSNN